MAKSWIVGLWIIAGLLWLVLTVANLYLGDLNQDEGWYLYAAGQVAQGKVLYRDFAFTQGPVMAYGYALANGLITRFGVAGGRAWTALLGLLAATAASCCAARLVPRRKAVVAALMAFILIAVCVYHSYFTTVVKTYALSALWLALGTLFLTFAGSSWSALACFLSGAMFSLAAGTRISAGVVLPVTFVYLVARHKDLGWKGWFFFGLGGGLALGAIFLPFFLVARDGFLFGMFGYHTSRWVGEGMKLLVYKAGFISRLVQAYFVAVMAWVALILLRFVKSSADEPDEEDPAPARLSVLLWLLVAGVTLVHLSAPFPYDDYQVMIYPVFAAAIAAGLVRSVRIAEAPGGARPMRWMLLLVFVAATAASFSSPINQQWVLRGRDRIWWLMKDEPDLVKLQKVGARIREWTEPEDLIITQDAYIAVEARRSVPSGMEMGAFSYYADWTTEEAEKVHVLNRERLLNILATSDAPVAAFSGYSLSIKAPEVALLSDEEQAELWKVVFGRYVQVDQVPHFGQAHTTLVLLRLEEDVRSQIPGL